MHLKQQSEGRDEVRKGIEMSEEQENTSGFC